MHVDRNAPTRLSKAETPDPFLGRTFDGYRVDALLGHGGMGAVYQATQLSLNRTVAIKVLPEDLRQNPQFHERFHREVDVLSKLSHPNVVTVFDRGEVDGRPYLVMEYIAGTSLREILRRGPLPPDEALVLVRSILSALEHAHDAEIIHRDIKPENVLLAPGGVVKVADFGLSRLLGNDPVTRLTHTNLLLGTFEYMSPEQRERAREADARSDLYATGVVLYEMIAGELPIGSFDPLSTRRPGECDQRLDDVVKKSLQKDPARRYQKATEMADAVSQLLDRVPAAARTSALASVSERIGFDPLKFAKNLDLLATFTNVIALAGCVAGVVWMFDPPTGHGRVSYAYVIPALGIWMFAWFCVETATQLRRFGPGARTGQGLLSLAALPSGILTPYAIFAWWLLHRYPGRTYFEGRARGLGPDQAVSSIAEGSLDPDAPLTRHFDTKRRVTSHASPLWLRFIAAILLSGLWPIAFFVMGRHNPRLPEILMMVWAILGTFWLFLFMPAVYRRGVRGPLFAFVSIGIYLVVCALGIEAVDDVLRSRWR